MLPPKKLNIYPRTDENIEALISFYFDELDVNQDGALEAVNKHSSLTINQIEYIFNKLKEAYQPIFKKRLSGTITLKNLITYGVDALKNSEPNRSGSQNRQKITKEFAEYVRQNEIDFKHLQRNN